MGIDVIVVGLGFGADFVPIYQAHESVGRVAVVDSNPDRTASVADRFDVADRFASLEEALHAPGWDAVHLVTPVALHAGQVQQVLKSGRHCASAVPMATTLNDLDQLIAAQDEAGRNYMMMETAAYSREYFHARSLLDSGRLGRPAYFRGEHLQNLDGYPPYWLGYPPMHYVTHALSPALALTGERVESVRCLGSSRLTSDHIGVAGEGFGTEAGLFKLSGDEDLVANVTMSFFQLGRSYLEGFSVYGDSGALEWPQLEGGPMKEFAMLPHEPGQRGRVVIEKDVCPTGAADLLPESLRRFTDGGHSGSHPHLVHEFVSSILEERRPRVDARTAATWTAPGICAHQSALQGGTEVFVPDYGAR
ncbi:Gfo/Idh/MocA family oxidoreductase [Kribbella qitaiheensis]|uniref:Gfo/Idh/MocA family oxidoreductase n=1 Tax=Kribbella qitaiheensis TaxID=1544730 RepID=A0A7G6X557_9ACTN|nr:Gfo/Idh/MocA family oxidoreductase [Kribbella qitaiheensis]QNE21372.1 Gfo/Idh/MocA family oxidoreductase [Kribbella qitaiheensis]